MASVDFADAGEASRSGKRKIYISCKSSSDVRRQKKIAGNKCDHRKGCGTSQ